MAEYLEPPIETDPDILAESAFDYLQSIIPGWQPNEGNLDVWLIQAMARHAAELRDLASAVPDVIFRYYGQSIIGLNPIDASSAGANSTWGVIDDSGYTIPAGTIVGLRATGDELVPFEVVNDVVIAPGDTTTAVGEVVLAAVEPGVRANGLAGPGELIDTLDFVDTVVLVADTAGGVDAEDDDVYLDRLTTQLQLLSPRPIIPADFAAMAQNVPGVERALAIDGYNPANQTYNNERMVAIAVVDALGNAVSTGIKDEVDTLLQAEREINFIVNVIDPTYTLIDVTFTAVGYEGFDYAAIEAEAEQAVRDYLSPANWGRPSLRGDVGTARTWVKETAVRYLELAQVINNVQGIHYITALTFNIDGQAPGTADINLAGAAPLPNDETVIGTVNPP